MRDREGGRKFSFYIKKLRERQNVSMEQLCRGLCDVRMIRYLENGEREPGRLLQEILLERLGVGAEDYELFLDYVEYGRWKLRQQILHHITFEEPEIADGLLEQYRRAYCKEAGPEGWLAMDITDRLERQFYLSMLGQIRRMRGSSRKELRDLYDEALELTVPAAEKQSAAELTLSLKELNLILEAEQCREQQRPERYLEVAEYACSGRLDRRGMAKICPKAIYLLYLCLKEQEHSRIKRENGNPEAKAPETGKWNICMLLRYCNRALDILRDNGKMYYLWEILSMRENLLSCLMDMPPLREQCEGITVNPEAAEKLLQENRQWREVLESVYDEFRVPRETFEYCYLYVVKGVGCINDIIRVRRMMLGFSQSRLCEGICDVKTLRRLERCRTVPQRAIVEKLFERLGLSGELTRTDLVTDSPEARKLMELLRECANEYQWEKADRLMEQIKQLVPANDRTNRQILLNQELVSRWKTGKLDDEIYCNQMVKILELTLPYEAFLQEGEKYLTINEQTCIQNLMQGLEGMEGRKAELLICMHRFEDMYRSFLKDGLQEAVAGKYEFILGHVESVLGNMGEYDKADQYNLNIIRGCLRFRRLTSLSYGIYERWWNHAERRKRNIPTDKILDDIKELKKCTVLSILGQQWNSAQFYRKKVKQICKN